jgi:hypothetical protein
MKKSEFAKDFGEFFAEVEKEGIEATVKDMAMLYAIYRKDLRANNLNNNRNNNRNNSYEDPGKEPATERQKNYLMDLAYKKGVCITQKELDRMTREKASETIETLLGGD